MKVRDTPFIINFGARIGSGAYGTVYRAYNTEKPLQKICCKVIEVKKGESFEKLKEEVKIIERLEYNQNIVQIIKPIVHSKDQQFIFMELCDGGNMESYIQKNKPLQEIDIILFLQQFIDGYYELDKRRILHCDLKPENILIHKGKFKIADFGLSQKLLFDGQQVPSKGSLLTRAPELFNKKYRDERYLNQKDRSKADMWSLGCILYNMMYAENLGHPYLGKIENIKFVDDIEKQACRMINETQQIFFFDSPQYSQELKNLVTGLVHKDIEKRTSYSNLINSTYIFPQEKKNNLRDLLQLTDYRDSARISGIFQDSQMESLITCPQFNFSSFFEKKKQVLEEKGEIIISQDILEDAKVSDQSLRAEIDSIEEQQSISTVKEKIIEAISTKCFFLREIAYFHDKCALELYGLNRIFFSKIENLINEQKIKESSPNERLNQSPNDLKQNKSKSNNKNNEELKKKEKIEELQKIVSQTDKIIVEILNRGIDKAKRIYSDLPFAVEEIKEFMKSPDYIMIEKLRKQDEDGMNQFDLSISTEAQLRKFSDQENLSEERIMANVTATQFLQRFQKPSKQGLIDQIIEVLKQFSFIMENLEDKDSIYQRHFLICFLYLAQFIQLLRGNSQFFSSKFEDNPTIQFLRYYESIESTILPNHLERLNEKVVKALIAEDIQLIISI